MTRPNRIHVFIVRMSFPCYRDYCQTVCFTGNQNGVSCMHSERKCSFCFCLCFLSTRCQLEVYLQRKGWYTQIGGGCILSQARECVSCLSVAVCVSVMQTNCSGGNLLVDKCTRLARRMTNVPSTSKIISSRDRLKNHSQNLISFLPVHILIGIL